MEFKELQKRVSSDLKEHGNFYNKWNSARQVLENHYKITETWQHQEMLIDLAEFDLMHSEISEASEEIRDGNREKAVIELAGLIIRVMCYCENQGFDLEKYIISESERNKTRPKLHGRKVI
jgi:hypothetical protein